MLSSARERPLNLREDLDLIQSQAGDIAVANAYSNDIVVRKIREAVSGGSVDDLVAVESQQISVVAEHELDTAAGGEYCCC